MGEFFEQKHDRCTCTCKNLSIIGRGPREIMLALGLSLLRQHNFAIENNI